MSTLISVEEFLCDVGAHTAIWAYPVQRLVLKLAYRGSPGNENVDFNTEELALAADLGLSDYIKGDLPVRELILIWGRRTGKTWVMTLMALYEIYRLLESPGEIIDNSVVKVPGAEPKILIIETSAPQVGIAVNQATELLVKLPYFQDKLDVTSTRACIDFHNPKNGARASITYSSSNSNTELLGFPWHTIFFMEIASWKRGKAEQHLTSLSPAAATFKHGKTVVISTPRCAGDLLWRLRNNPTPRRMVSQAATWVVNPRHTERALREECQGESFANEFASAFEEDSTAEQVTFRLKVATINRIKKRARQRAYEMDQDITYTDVIRDILEREFPPQ
jgi:hypothetical protein